MEGSQLAQSLVSLRGMHLRYVYALLCELHVWDLVSTKTKDVFSKEQSSHFFTWLDRETEKLKDEPDEELQLDLLLQLSKALKIESRLFDLPTEIERQCEEIVDEAFGLLKKQYKELEQYYDQAYSKNKLEVMIHWQMKLIYDHLAEKKTESPSPLPWVKEMEQYLSEVPDYFQEQLKEVFEVESLKEKDLSTVISKKGILFVFSEITKRTGLVFYRQLLESFSAETTKLEELKSDTIYFAWMMNPNVLLSLIFSGGTVLYRYQYLLFNKGLVPIVLMQTVLPYFAEEHRSEKDINVLSVKWNERYQIYRTILRTINENMKEQEEWEHALSLLKEDRQSIQSIQYKNESYMKQLKDKLTGLLKDDEQRPYLGDLSVKYSRLKERYDKVSEKLTEKETEKKGVLRAVSGYIKTGIWQTEKLQLEKKLAKIYDEMTELVIEKYVDYEPELIVEIRQVKLKLDEIQEELRVLDEREKKVNEKLSALKESEKNQRIRKEQAEKRTYGLKKMHALEMGRAGKGSINKK
ncbi:MAG TPA: hypothetical protein VEY51_14900 [Chondromyces sp.]|nr:hypothetical protein [Chondromyces sp.]